MKLIHRIAYYGGGFFLGIIFLIFFLSGKRTSCAYGPNARTIKSISTKKHFYTEDAKLAMQTYSLDTLTVQNLIRSSDVNFSKSKIKGDSCNTYLLENKFEDRDIELWIKNCDTLATIQSVLIN